ncbi:MAG: phosphatidyl-myo-inositol dimannoside synthase [Chloroflexia bacterium]|jgi:glycosyltransferase involved in cell wall biosynthesis|nr:phosphatidyl-myo-inositol dimannoside synthase [Chloroflexia bacterium]
MATRRLRVLYFIGSYSPELMGNVGHEQAILALMRRGHEVEVLTQINEPGVQRYSRTVYSGVPTYRVNLATAGGPISGLVRRAAGQFLKYEHTVTLLAALRRHLRRHHYDLLHVEGVYPFGAAAALGAGKTPYMANVQGADVIELPENDYGYRRFPLPRAAVRLALRRAALVRVNSPFMIGYLTGEHLAERERIVMVPRVLEDSAFPPPAFDLQQFRRESRALLSERYGIGLPNPVVMSLSRLHPFKGLEYLVDAVPLVAAAMRVQGKPVPWFVLCGPSRSTENYGDYREFLLKRAGDLGVAQHLIFTGQVAHPEVRQHLAGADIVASPSVVEALHRVALEAAAVGTPTVVSETTGAASYLAPHDACMAVAPRSPQAIADAITRMLAEPDLYNRVRDNGLNVAEGLRVDPVAEQLEAAWLRAAVGAKR